MDKGAEILVLGNQDSVLRHGSSEYFLIQGSLRDVGNPRRIVTCLTQGEHKAQPKIFVYEEPQGEAFGSRGTISSSSARLAA
jgi:hypothetical protein